MRTHKPPMTMPILKNNKYILPGFFVLIAIVIGLIISHDSGRNKYETPPIIKPASIILKEQEPFKKEVVLINLHHQAKNQFLPKADFSLRSIKARHFDSRTTNYDYPWSMDFFPDGNILIALHHGALLLYEVDKKQVSRINNLPDNIATDSYQLGLLDLMVDPDFSRNNQIYFTYTAARKTTGNTQEYTTCVVSAKLKQMALKHKKRFCVAPWHDSTTQFGGVLALDNNENILFSVGDRAHRHAAQNIHSNLGKILRLNKNNLKFSFSNPFTENRLIWSLGHRNPQGLFYDRQKDVLYETEHGPQGGDEVNIIHRGLNYGWPVISYGHEYENGAAIGEGSTKAGLAQPLYYYAPSIATSAIMLYQGKMFPEWRDSLFIASLAGYHINHLTLHNDKVVSEARFFGYLQSRIRDIKEGPDGAIYILSEDGFILRLFR